MQIRYARMQRSFDRLCRGGPRVLPLGRLPAGNGPSDLDLARLAADAYKTHDSAPPGWRRRDAVDLAAAGIAPEQLEDPATGLRAAIYQDAEGRTVLAYAGSNDLPDWLNKLAQGVGLDAAQYRQAIALAKDAKLAFGDQLAHPRARAGGGRRRPQCAGRARHRAAAVSAAARQPRRPEGAARRRGRPASAGPGRRHGGAPGRDGRGQRLPEAAAGSAARRRRPARAQRARCQLPALPGAHAGRRAVGRGRARREAVAAWLRERGIEVALR